jgi:DNA polymerase I
MQEHGLALNLGKPPILARDLLRAHRETYPKFWRWSDSVVDDAVLTGSLQTTFGWTLRLGQGANPRAVRNFHMQAGGAEMLRSACCLATERGIEVCAPVHDALLICAPIERLSEDVAATRAAMGEASRIVLDGFEVRTEAKIVRHPDRYSDKRGARMWAEVFDLIGGVERQAVVRGN